MIRQAMPDDAPVLSEILRRSFRDVADRFGLTAENCPTHPSNCEPQWIADAMNRGARFHLLICDGVSCGCVALRIDDDGSAWLERLAVLPEYQGMGFGKALVERVLAQAASEGHPALNIAIIAHHTDLRHWYEHLAFHETSTRHFPSLPFDVLFMTRVLPART